MRFVRAYSAVFSLTLLVTTLPTGLEGLVGARTLTDAHYNNSIGVNDQFWLMVGGFVLGVALAQSLYTRRRHGRLRAYELAVAIFLGLWVSMGISFAFATAEWGGLGLAAMSSIIAPLAPWTEPKASVPRRVGLTLLAVGAVACIGLSSAQFLDSGFLFFLFAAPLAGLGGTLGILGAERIVERERVRRTGRDHPESTQNHATPSSRSVA